MSNQKKAYLFACITIIFWSTVATAFKLALSEQSGLQVLLLASITSAILLFFYLLFTRQAGSLLKTTKKELVYSGVLGFINPTLYYLILFVAYNNLPAQVAQPLNMIWPIILVLISIPFLGHKITLKSIVAMFISFGGIVLVSSQGAGEEFRPEQVPYMLIAVGTSVIWALFWILNMKDKRNESLKLFLNFLFSSIYLLIALLISGQSFPSTVKNILLDIYIGLFEMGLAYLFWLKALQFSKTTDKISNLVFIFPFISLIFIHYILGEKIHLTTIYGLLLVVIGILLQRFKSKNENEEYRKDYSGN